MVSEHDGGGQAYIYRVTDTLDEHRGEWALKKLKNSKRHERFSREILALRKLQGHPNIVTLIDADGAEEPSWFVMALGEGSLEKCMPTGGYSIEKSFQLFREICAGVAALHDANVIHRDLKPDNIIITDENARVGDLGLCLIEDMGRITPDWEAVGPRYFMAPEAEAGRDDDADVSMDVYSLGKLFYWFLTGKILHREKIDDPAYALPGRNQYQALDEFKSVIRSAIQEHKRDRIRTVTELLRDFEAAIIRFEDRPERSLELKRKDKGMDANFFDLQPLTEKENAEFARQVLDVKIVIPSDQIWPLAREVGEQDANLALRLLEILDESILSALIPDISDFYFGSIERAQSFSWASLGWKDKDIRPQIIHHVVSGEDISKILIAIKALGVLNLKEHLDLGNTLKKLGHPASWSTDIIVAVSMQDYPGRSDDIHAILDNAGSDVDRFMLVVPLLMISENLSADEMIAAISEYEEKNKNSPDFQSRWKEYHNRIEINNDDESGDT